MNKKHESEFENVIKPVMKYLAENYHPHVKVIVDGSSAEIVEVHSSISTSEFIRD
ncbi:hypothetical protein [Providencia heimbachae]|uniref:hypothetical protein n=1 Tax=Providencia heimbachae TaxID=333962 RepID=UPI000A825797|nr:hypothetical protein [Providencia heimbachae]NIH23398.1 hypothetical protein [Providencia heimbachae]